MSIMDVLSKAYEADPESGKVLLDHVAMSLIEEEAEQYAKRLDPILFDAMQERVRVAKVAAGRSYVAKTVNGDYPSDVVRVAEWLTGIDNYIEVLKAGGLHFDWFDMPTGDQRRVLRDAMGRFASINGSATVQGQIAGSRTLATPVENVTDRKKDPNGAMTFYDVKGDKQQAEEFQGGYENAVKLAGEWRDKLGSSAKDAVVEIKAKGLKAPIRVTLTALAQGNIPDDLDVRNAFTAMRVVASQSATAGSKNSIDSMYAATAGGFNRIETANALMNNTAALFGARDKDSSRLNSFLSRIGATTDVLNAAGQPQLAAVASIIGSYGPQAALVAEPHVRRAAYRYRGTERTPDPEIMQHFREDYKTKLNAYAKELERSDGASPKELAAAAVADRDQHEPYINSLTYRTEQMDMGSLPASGDSLRLGVRSDVAALELLKTIPKRKMIGELSRESGHVLPSQGVIIDRDGDVVTQSVGFADDHYLPFDLKNMKRLRGGQYVRTRQQGGLTGEDIYAAIFHGARSATVASASGVFRIEFAPDFRGARANSDKAFSMYNRYLEILGAIQNSDMYLRDVDPSAEAAERARLRRINPTWDKKAMDDKIAEWKRAERAKQADLGPDQVKTLKERALAEVKRTRPNLDDAQAARMAEPIFADLYEQAQDDKVRALNLNGDGYALALATLQAQFPYFIRSVESEPLRGTADADKMHRKGRVGEGFLGKMGQANSPADRARYPKASRSDDRGYVQRDKLLSRENSFGKPEAETKGASPEAGAKPQTAATKLGVAKPSTAQQAASSAPAAEADTESPAARAAANKGRYTDEDVKKLQTSFISNMRSVYTSLGRQQQMMEDGKFVHSFDEKQMADQPLTSIPLKADRLKWFFSRSNDAQIADAFDKYADTLFSDFSNSTVDELSLALSEVWDQTALDDLLDSVSPFEAKTKKELFERIRGNAMNVAEAELLKKPFAKDTGENLRNEFARAIGFSDITNIGNADEVREYAKEFPEIATIAEELGSDDEGLYLSHAALSERMKQTLERVKKLEERAKWYQEAVSAGDEAGKKKALMSRQQILAEGPLPGIDDESIDSMFEDGSSTDLSEQLINLQKARTFVEVSRVYDALRASEGGGAGPKLRPGWVWKAQPSLRVEVLKADDPVSLAFQREWALGRR